MEIKTNSNDKSSIFTNENNYHEMSSDYCEYPAQIPIRKSRFNYLINDYCPKKTDRWIMINHPGHFLIYEHEFGYCIYDAEYILLKDRVKSDPEPIAAVITNMRINKDPVQHPNDIEDDFDKVADLILLEL